MNGSHTHDDLSRFWDDLVDRAPGVSPRGLDPSLAGTIRRLHALPNAPAPSWDYAARLRQALVTSTDGQGVLVSWPQMPPVSGPSERATRAGAERSERRIRPNSVWHGHPVVSYLSLAVLLLVIVGGAWLAFERNGDQYGKNDNDVRIEITGPVPPLADNPIVRLRRVSLEPGALFMDVRNGPAIILAENGTFSLRTRSGEFKATLRPGESATATALTTIVIRNDAPVAGAFLIAQVYPNASHLWGINLEEGVMVSDLVYAGVSHDLSTATFSLRQVTLAPGERLDSWQTHGQTWITASEGSLGLTFAGEDGPGLPDSGWARTLDPGVVTAIPDDTTVDIENVNVTPVVVTILTITPPEESTPP